MTRRYTLDRSSFEQFLGAASLLQQFQKQLYRTGSDAQSLWTLVATQRAIESGELDLNAALARIPDIAERLIPAAGAGLWLFTADDQFAWRAGTPAFSEDERLRLEVLHRLAALENGKRQPNRNWDAGYFPGCVKSLIVEPVRQGSRIAGALASFSTDFDAFTEREIRKLRLLAAMLTDAVDRASRSGVTQAAALEQSVMRRLIDKLVPQLQTLADQELERRNLLANPDTEAPTPASQEPEIPAAPVQVMQGPYEVPASASALELSTAADQVDETVEAEQPAQIISDMAAEPGSEDGDANPVEEIYVPGIGVRSALYDDDPKEPSRIWTNLRSGITGGFAAFGSAVATVVQSFGKLGHGVADGASCTRRAVGARLRAARSHVTLPSSPAPGIREGVGQFRSTCRDLVSRVGAGIRTAGSHVPRPNISKADVQNTVMSAEHSAATALRAIGRGLRDAPNVIPDVPLPTDRMAQVYRKCADSVRHASTTSTRVLGQQLRQLRLPAVREWRLNRSAFRKGAPALLVLGVMLAFLLSELGFHKTLQTAAASTKTSIAPAAVILPSAKLPVPVQAGKPDLSNAPTHLKITDSEIANDLENMTRYEIATARRAAKYGDDISAFQLGMAYETGYDLRQSCSQAADWVKRAAEDGNAAAQYNLGLRYRDGDGVPQDPQRAADWLRKAAAHKYPKAESVLASLAH